MGVETGDVICFDDLEKVVMEGIGEKHYWFIV